MALRKAASYSKRHVTPYTRKSNVKAKSYIKAVPPQKIVKFKMGEVSAYNNGELKQVVKLISTENIVLRDNALEACRQYLNNIMTKLAPGQFYLEVRVFPHHILRENKMLTGAGADRMQTGMQLSFGATMGRAAIVKANQELFLIAVNTEKTRRTAYQTMKRIKAKIPCSSRLSLETLK